MITREHLINILRRELLNQDRDDLTVAATDTPDTFLVTGPLDLHRLAEAILYATRWDQK